MPICEKVRFSICCEENLSIEFTEHVKNCPDCCQYKKQQDDIKNMLSQLTVPNLPNGTVTESVMKTLCGTAKPKPKFKFLPCAYNYVGTAAAVIIIAALFISSKGWQVLNVNNSSAEQNISDSVVEYYSYDASNESVFEEGVQIKNAHSAVRDSEIETANSGMEGTPIFDKNESITEESVSQKLLKSPSALTDSVQSSDIYLQDDSLDYPVGESIQYDSDADKHRTPDYAPFPSDFVDSSGGALSKDADFEITESEDAIEIPYPLFSAVTQNTSTSIFDVSTFDVNANALSSNIYLANSFVTQNFESAHIIDYDYIAGQGIDNDIFISWICTVSDYRLYNDAELIKFAKTK